jgi:AraC family transcriptional regulator
VNNVQNSYLTVDATLETPSVIARLVSFGLSTPIDEVFPGTEAHWLYRFVTPRLPGSRLCFTDRWEPERFEPLGDIFLAPAGHTLRARCDSGQFNAILCQFHPESMSRWFEDDMKWTEQNLEAGLDIRSMSIRYLLQRFEAEIRDPGFASEALAELIAEQLVIELARYYNAPLDNSIGSGLASWRLRLIDERLAELDASPTLTELAELCSISVRQLTRAFRTSRGCSIGDYIAQNRIDRSRRLLEEGESIKAVAYTLGFASTAAFTYAFRRATGLTPGQYRAQVRRGK